MCSRCSTQCQPGTEDRGTLINNFKFQKWLLSSLWLWLSQSLGLFYYKFHWHAIAPATQPIILSQLQTCRNCLIMSSKMKVASQHWTDWTDCDNVPNKTKDIFTLLRLKRFLYMIVGCSIPCRVVFVARCACWTVLYCTWLDLFKYLNTFSLINVHWHLIGLSFIFVKMLTDMGK